MYFSSARGRHKVHAELFTRALFGTHSVVSSACLDTSPRDNIEIRRVRQQAVTTERERR